MFLEGRGKADSEIFRDLLELQAVPKAMNSLFMTAVRFFSFFFFVLFTVLLAWTCSSWMERGHLQVCWLQGGLWYEVRFFISFLGFGFSDWCQPGTCIILPAGRSLRRRHPAMPSRFNKIFSSRCCEFFSFCPLLGFHICLACKPTSSFSLRALLMLVPWTTLTLLALNPLSLSSALFLLFITVITLAYHILYSLYIYISLWLPYFCYNSGLYSSNQFDGYCLFYLLVNCFGFAFFEVLIVSFQPTLGCIARDLQLSASCL